MPSAKNQDQVKDLAIRFEKAKSIVVADYSGINVADQTKLRAKISEAGGELFVSKNRLFKVAAEQHVGKSELLDEALNGQNAFLFSIDDAVASIKALFEFAKENENLKIKVGLLDGKVLSFEETKNLSSLPSKPELIGQLMRALQGPASGLVNVLQGPTRGLVYALSAIKDKKSE